MTMEEFWAKLEPFLQWVLFVTPDPLIVGSSENWNHSFEAPNDSPVRWSKIRVSDFWIISRSVWFMCKWTPEDMRIWESGNTGQVEGNLGRSVSHLFHSHTYFVSSLSSVPEVMTLPTISNDWTTKFEGWSLFRTSLCTGIGCSIWHSLPTSSNLPFETREGCAGRRMDGIVWSLKNPLDGIMKVQWRWQNLCSP